MGTNSCHFIHDPEVPAKCGHFHFTGSAARSITIKRRQILAPFLKPVTGHRDRCRAFHSTQQTGVFMHPYPKPTYPKWPAVPILKPPTDHAGYFATTPDADGRCAQWGCDEFYQEAQAYITQQVPGTHEARSAQYYCDVLAAATGNLWQVQGTPNLDAQQQASVDAGTRLALMLGQGLTGWSTALHQPSDGSAPTAIQGGAFACDNYKNGVISFHGVEAEDVLQIMRNGLTDFIRKGGIIE
jgi:hypothetical protein